MFLDQQHTSDAVQKCARLSEVDAQYPQKRLLAKGVHKVIGDRDPRHVRRRRVLVGGQFLSLPGIPEPQHEIPGEQVFEVDGGEQTAIALTRSERLIFGMREAHGDGLTFGQLAPQRAIFLLKYHG